MHYLYHRIPRDAESRSDMRGHILYPLNDLRALYPDVYQRQAAKYTGREHVTRQTIPLLDNCAWNSVLFLSSVHPQDFKDAFVEAGGDPSIERSFYQIDPTSLDQDKLAVWLFPTTTAPGKPVTPDEFVPYRYEDLAAYSTIPSQTKDYYAKELQAGQPIRLFWRWIPHILYRGPIDISNAKIIRV